MITHFQKYIKESSELEIIKMKRNMADIHDELIMYDEVMLYLQKELLGETVHVDVVRIPKSSIWISANTIIKNVDIKVIDIYVSNQLQIVFVDNNGVNFIIPDHANLEWEKLIGREYSDVDPYGEEEIE
jgi:NurA-like 5'-3' nuclease